MLVNDELRQLGEGARGNLNAGDHILTDSLVIISD